MAEGDRQVAVAHDAYVFTVRYVDGAPRVLLDGELLPLFGDPAKAIVAILNEVELLRNDLVTLKRKLQEYGIVVHRIMPDGTRAPF